MASITRVDVENCAPEFAATSDVVMDCYIDIACSLIKHPAWAGKGANAAALLTAHFLTLQKVGVGGGSGAVVKKRVGSVEVAFSSGGSTDPSGLDSTSYGRTYLLCRNSIPEIRLPFTTC